MKNRLTHILMYKLILYPIAFVVFVLSSVRNKLYDFKILKRTYSKLPVISIGNIQMGGTGKTPFVVSLCEKLLQKIFSLLSLLGDIKEIQTLKFFLKHSMNIVFKKLVMSRIYKN